MKIPDDPFVQELLPEFVDTWIADFKEQYNKYIVDKNSSELYRLAHTLKGSCFQFGLDDIAEMGIRVMGFAKALDWVSASKMEEPILNAFVEVKVFVKKHLG